MLEVRSSRLEAGSRKREDRGWRMEDGRWR